ncbi:MAG: hypothetical protein IJY89_06475 [Clostridia bacterium]|nr:hypothetical protein [Clostridia bacterium]
MEFFTGDFVRILHGSGGGSMLRVDDLTEKRHEKYYRRLYGTKKRGALAGASFGALRCGF